MKSVRKPQPPPKETQEWDDEIDEEEGGSSDEDNDDDVDADEDEALAPLGVKTTKDSTKKKKAELLSLIKNLNSLALDSDLLSAYITSVQYVGFDPVEIMRALCQANKDENLLGKHMQFLICLFLHRGSSVVSPTGLSKIKSSTKNTVSKLVSTYSIKAKVGNDKSVITLPRIAATFPLLTAQILINQFEDLSRPWDATSFQQMTGVQLSPLWTFLGSLVFFNKSWKTDIAGTIVYQVYCSWIINTKNRAAKDATKRTKSEWMDHYFKQAITYGTAVLNSSISVGSHSFKPTVTNSYPVLTKFLSDIGCEDVDDIMSSFIESIKV